MNEYRPKPQIQKLMKNLTDFLLETSNDYNPLSGESLETFTRRQIDLFLDHELDGDKAE